MASAHCSYAEPPKFFCRNSCALYEEPSSSCGRSGNMGVLVTSAWPMSQRIYDRPLTARSTVSLSPASSSAHCRRSMREKSDSCLSCHHSQTLPRNHHLHQQQQHSSCGSGEVACGGGVRSVRPFSVPPTLMMNDVNGGCDSNQMEMMPLGMGPHPAVVPSRASLSSLHPASPPTCVPWLKKMKVIKKLQRKIGIGNRGGGISPNNLPPLLFNNVHGENVTLSRNGSVAKRTNSFCKGIVFSDRSVKVNEKVCIKFVEVSQSWSGVLRFGFTSHDPSNMRNCLPRYACPDLTSKAGFWAKAFSDLYVKKDAILYFYVNAAGDVYFGINGEEKGLFFSGVDTRGSLWVLIDIYGNTTGIEFVDARAQLNNSRSNVSESQPALPTAATAQVVDTQQSPMSPPVPPEDPYRLTGSALLKVLSVFPHVALNVDSFNPITKGKNALSVGSIAYRREGEYSNAYVFPYQPLRSGETIVILVQEVDYAFASSMAFGLTSCNPKVISHVGFPDDAFRLLDRPEYWVVEKDVANSPAQGDVIGFTITPEGEVIMTKNNEPPKLLMHVDNSVPLFPFFDLYGTTTQIRLAGIVPASFYRPRPPAETRGRTELPRSSSMQAPSSSYNVVIHKAAHSASSSNCATSKVGASSSNVAASGAMSTDKQTAVSYPTLIVIQKQVSGPSVSPASSRDPPSNWSVECVACCERPVDSVFYSCGHMCMCYQCACEYWKTKDRGCCPICRATISDVIRTYKS